MGGGAFRQGAGSSMERVMADRFYKEKQTRPDGLNLDREDVVTVPVKSSMLSKINWTQGVGVLASILAIWNIEMTAEVQAATVIVIQFLVAIITATLRSKFTTAITKGSLARAERQPL